MSDPVTAVPDELRTSPARPDGALALLGRADFRNVYLAVAASEVGDALHYIALMWFAFAAGGPLGVVAVRLADSVPALVFGLHGGLAADRWDRRRMMIGADLVRAAVLVPVAVAGVAGRLPLAGLVVAAFVLETATSYFAPAYGSLLPAIVERANVQQANALVQATAQALFVCGWGLAAVLVAALPISTFFAVNAASFALSAALIARVQVRGAPRASTLARGIRRDEASAGSGRWRNRSRRRRDRVRRDVDRWRADPRARCVASRPWWILGRDGRIRLGLDRKRCSARADFSPAEGTRESTRMDAVLAGIRPDGCGRVAVGRVRGAFAAALGQSSAVVLLNSAAQEEVPDSLLGRVVGLISLTHRGAHATGLLLVSPVFAFVAPRVVFVGAALALPIVGLSGAALSTALARGRRGRGLSGRRR